MTNSKSWGRDPGACKSPLGATDPAQGIKAARLRDKTGNSPQKIQGWFSLPASVYRQKPGLWQIPQWWPHPGNWCERRCSVPACLAQCGPRRASFASCKSCPMVDLRKAENCSGAGKSSVSVWVWNRETTAAVPTQATRARVCWRCPWNANRACILKAKAHPQTPLGRSKEARLRPHWYPGDQEKLWC